MEQVVLVNEQNEEIGVADKDTVHTKNTPLHRAFSLFLFNNKKQLLLTRRSDTKKAFPGIWTNTACGHPAPGESAVDAVKRRLQQELGIMTDNVDNLREVSPYRYRFADNNGIVENEICPIFTAVFDGNPKPVKQEVDDWKWMDWKKFLEDSKKHPELYSPWSIEESLILNNSLESIQVS